MTVSNIVADFRSDKISTQHLQRWAIVYVRQSSPQQVLDHKESTELQYALVERAVALGWPRDRISVIDDDLGITARIADARDGFHHLLAEVALEHVGIVLGIDMSRLARNGKDWGHLFDICTHTHTLLADRDGVYDPRQTNDRVLLGMKGIMSEVELHTLHGRLHDGRMNKAQRGELFIAVPCGYQILPDGTADKDTDEQARHVTQMVFDQFDQLGSGYAVFVWLRKNNIGLPIRPHTGPHRRQLQWRQAALSTVQGMLRHPIYAGVYTYGRLNGDTLGPRPQDQWAVFLPSRLPAYISWEKYLKNQEKLHQNRNGPANPGTPKNGSALLGGLAFCGRCRRQLYVDYHGRGQKDVYYVCDRAGQLGMTDSCHGIKACVLDALVTRRLMSALEPAALELSWQAAQDLTRQRERLDEHWQQQLQRAEYEASRAQRQYEAVEPENRLVARRLETRWEETLRQWQQLNEQYARFQAEQPLPPGEGELAAIERLSRHIPWLWQSAEVTSAERTQIVRCLLTRVDVRVQDGSERVDVTLHWQGGFTSQEEVVRPVAHYSQLSYYDALLSEVTQLCHSGHTAAETVERLNAAGFRPPRGERFNTSMVYQLRRRCRGEEGENEWRICSLSRQLSLPESRLRDWLRRGWMRGEKRRGAWIAWADADELNRLSQLASYAREHGRFACYPSDLTTPKEVPKS